MFYVSRNLAAFYNLRKIRLSRISAEIFVQPAEFSKKNSAQGSNFDLTVTRVASHRKTT